MQIAAMMAGIPLSNAGPGISHGLGHQIGGVFHIHHGLLVMLFIPYELQVYYKVTDRHLKICDLLGVRDKSDEKSLQNLIKKLHSFMDELKIKKSIKDYGVSQADFDKNLETLIEHSINEPAFYYGWFTLTPEQLKDIYVNAYKGNMLNMNSKIWR